MRSNHKIELQIPENVSAENINDADENWWNNLDTHSRIHFNYLIEYAERNEQLTFALDLFKIEGTENKIQLHKILRAGYWNMAFEAANHLNDKE